MMSRLSLAAVAAVLVLLTAPLVGEPQLPGSSCLMASQDGRQSSLRTGQWAQNNQHAPAERACQLHLLLLAVPP